MQEPVAAKALRPLKALRKDVLVRACCHAMLLAYRRAGAPPLSRADTLLACMRKYGTLPPTMAPLHS